MAYLGNSKHRHIWNILATDPPGDCQTLSSKPVGDGDGGIRTLLRDLVIRSSCFRQFGTILRNNSNNEPVAAAPAPQSCCCAFYDHWNYHPSRLIANPLIFAAGLEHRVAHDGT